MFKLLLSASFFVSLDVAFQLRPKLDGRIIGGEEAVIEDYPYQVSFRLYDEHNCGGSILDETTILTAAHCTDGFLVQRMSVRAGSTKEAEGGQLIKVAKVIQHELWNDRTYDYDISLLKLESPLVFSEGVQPVSLQDEDEEVPVGTTAVITGWGDTVNGGEIYPENLLRVNVQVISDEKCSDDYGSSGRITKNMLCAQTPGKDSCQGDSGGPLVANGKQIGVVSWGIGCANPKYPGVYSKISVLRPWIEKNLRQ